MQHDQYGQLLLQAISETLETMAFAEIVPYSMKIGNRELLNPGELRTAASHNLASAQSNSGLG
jgi:hypothetical protein